MGVETEIDLLAVPLGRPLDWNAGARAIYDLPFAHMWQDSSSWFDWERWLYEWPDEDVPEVVATFRILRAAQNGLLDELDSVRAAVEHGHDELPWLDVDGSRVWIAYSQAELTDVHEALALLGDVGALEAVGFSQWPGRVGGPQGELLEDLGEDDEDRRKLRLALTASLVAGQIVERHNAQARVQLPALRRQIDEMRSSPDPGRTLFRFVADGLLLCSQVRPDGDGSADDIDEMLVRTLEEDQDPHTALASIPTEPLPDLLELLAADIDDLLTDFPDSASGPLAGDVDGILRHTVRTALVGLSDLFGREAPAFLELPPPNGPTMPAGMTPAVSTWLTICAYAGSPDWDAARRHVESIAPEPLRSALGQRVDLAESECFDGTAWTDDTTIEICSRYFPCGRALAALHAAGALAASGCQATNAGAIDLNDGLGCPVCGGVRDAPIAFGFPSPEMEAQAAQGELILGGDVLDVSMMDVDRGCLECGHRWRSHAVGPVA